MSPAAFAVQLRMPPAPCSPAGGRHNIPRAGANTREKIEQGAGQSAAPEGRDVRNPQPLVVWSVVAALCALSGAGCAQPAAPKEPAKAQADVESLRAELRKVREECA